MGQFYMPILRVCQGLRLSLWMRRTLLTDQVVAYQNPADRERPSHYLQYPYAASEQNGER